MHVLCILVERRDCHLNLDLHEDTVYEPLDNGINGYEDREAFGVDVGRRPDVVFEALEDFHLCVGGRSGVRLFADCEVIEGLYEFVPRI